METTVPGGLYAGPDYGGPFLDIHNAYREFFNHWRKARRYRLADASPVELWRRPPLSSGEIACELLCAVVPTSNLATALT